MTWTAQEYAEMGADEVYSILRKHDLLPNNPVEAAATCNALASMSTKYLISGEGQTVAYAFVSQVIDGETAVFDFIPVPKHFRTGFDESIRGAVLPIFADLFDSRRIRRITAYAPYSRSRTKRALVALGFYHEGRLREAAHFHEKEPEDLRVLGLTRKEFEDAGSSLA